MSVSIKGLAFNYYIVFHFLDLGFRIFRPQLTMPENILKEVCQKTPSPAGTLSSLPHEEGELHRSSDPRGQRWLCSSDEGTFQPVPVPVFAIARE